jgi:hypothetical protein
LHIGIHLLRSLTVLFQITWAPNISPR